MHIYEDLQFEKVFPLCPRCYLRIYCHVSKSAQSDSPGSLVTVTFITPWYNTKGPVVFIDSSKYRIGNNLPSIGV